MPADSWMKISVIDIESGSPMSSLQKPKIFLNSLHNRGAVDTKRVEWMEIAPGIVPKRKEKMENQQKRGIYSNSISISHSAHVSAGKYFIGMKEEN